MKAQTFYCLTITPEERAAPRIASLVAAGSFRAAEEEYGAATTTHFGAHNGAAIADLCDQMARVLAVVDCEPDKSCP